MCKIRPAFSLPPDVPEFLTAGMDSFQFMSIFKLFRLIRLFAADLRTPSFSL